MTALRLSAKGKFLLCASLCVAGVILAGPFLHEFILEGLPDPLSLQKERLQVRTCLDRFGHVMRYFRNPDGEWKFDIPLSRVSPDAVKVMLGSEDSRFFEHSGVDKLALLRAAKQNLFHCRIVSGASTISMQLTLPPSAGRRSVWRKIRQIFYAQKLERLYSKNRILEMYLNNIHFGGRIYGIEAASLYYFGCHASELDLAKACVLCGLPQRPSYLRPDRHPERALKRRNFVLLQLHRRGILTEEEVLKIRSSKDPVFRNFTLPSVFEKSGRISETDHALESALCEAGSSVSMVRTSIDPEMQSVLLQLLRNAKERLPFVRDGAGCLLDSRTGEVLALVGTLDIHAQNAGFVDTSKAIRSAGSSLKPFLYAEAVEAGLIVPDTILIDAPLRYGSYTPGNYDGSFRGRVRASEALADSLNTPAVRLLAALGEKRLLSKFRSLGILEKKSRGREAGLSLALGSAGHTLRNITNAYRVFSCGGVFTESSFLYGGKKKEGKRIWSSGTAEAVSEMLRTRDLPGAPYPTAWKTGTSANHRDAWSFVFTPDFTLGVWFGNKDGSAAGKLNGFSCALPSASEMICRLYEYRAFSPWPAPGILRENVRLCTESGLRAGAYCTETHEGEKLKNIPLRCCTSCGKDALVKKGKILSPGEKSYLAGPDGKALLKLSCTLPNVHYYWGRKYLGSALQEYAFPVGRHTLYAFPEGGTTALSVSFLVEASEIP